MFIKIPTKFDGLRGIQMIDLIPVNLKKELLSRIHARHGVVSRTLG